MSNDIILSPNTLQTAGGLFTQIRQWCHTHQVAIGVGEMAVGVGLVAWGVNNGFIEMGSQVVGTLMQNPNTAAHYGALAGSGIGALAGAVIGAIGVVGMGTAIGIPAVLLSGGAAIVCALAGYTLTDVIAQLITPPIDLLSLASSGALLGLGIYLVVKGAQRILGTAMGQQARTWVKDATLHLCQIAAQVVARSIEEARAFAKDFKLSENAIKNGVKLGSYATGGVIGFGAGTLLAGGSVTVLGSPALGAVALSLGLISAPVWPVVAATLGCAALGGVAYKAITRRSKR
jgi:hypothetical protein